MRPDGGIRDHEPLRGFIAAYFRIILPLDALDADRDGEISAGEIRNAAAALKTLDKNYDGRLTALVIRPDPVAYGVALLRLDANEVRRRADLDGDGVVSWEEMLTAMKSGAW